MPSEERVRRLIGMVEAGRFVEAIEEFYAPDATMQENVQPARRGLDQLVAGERRVLAAFKEVRTLPVESFFIDGDRVVIRWVFEFVGHDGRSFRQDELAYQRWDGDRIVEERFYYDPSQREQGLASPSSASASSAP
jgi:ketosteroid isomerase-like protein